MEKNKKKPTTRITKKTTTIQQITVEGNQEWINMVSQKMAENHNQDKFVKQLLKDFSPKKCCTLL